MGISEKFIVQLTEDLHGFPTFAVHYRQIRYNFCHLNDVKAFMDKVYHIKSDELLAAQRKPRTRSAKKLVTVVRSVEDEKLRKVVATLFDSFPTCSMKEVTAYVESEFPGVYPWKKIANRITQMLTSKQIVSVGRGVYKKVSPDVISRELPADTGTRVED